MTLTKKLSAFWEDVLGLFALLFRALGEHDRRPSKCPPCPPALKKPDPFLYCQYYHLSLGLPVTWDNPDIYIFEGPVLVNPYDLQANTTYTVVARVWNNSYDVPVINLNVVFSYLSFGMGLQSNPIGATIIDLGVKGLPGCPAFAYMEWTTPAALGHYCLQVFLDPPDDLNWLNNLGQRNTQVAQPQSPATFTFTVGNHARPTVRTVRFAVDTYSIPPLPACEVIGRAPTGGRLVSKIAPPVPDGWTVVLTPDELTLDPGEERTVQAAISPPSGFAGTMPFNIAAIDDAGPFGGVTLTVQVP
jgi:hypothetical protein